MTKPGSNSPAGTPGPTDGPPVSDRRRFVRTGLGAVPVVMTLVSRPVLAQTQQCTAPSGFTSVNQSVPGGATCTGVTPGFWKQDQHFSSWPAGFYPVDVSGVSGHSATTFCSVFACMAGTYPATMTLLTVLSTGGGPPDDVGRHIVAALFNTLTGLVPASVLPVTTIKDIWMQYLSTGGGGTGYYLPQGATGPKWYHADIVSYLLTTMPA